MQRLEVSGATYIYVVRQLKVCRLQEGLWFDYERGFVYTSDCDWYSHETR
jgi:hypothetical protein